MNHHVLLPSEYRLLNLQVLTLGLGCLRNGLRYVLGVLFSRWDQSQSINHHILFNRAYGLLLVTLLFVRVTHYPNQKVVPWHSLSSKWRIARLLFNWEYFFSSQITAFNNPSCLTYRFSGITILSVTVKSLFPGTITSSCNLKSRPCRGNHYVIQLWVLRSLQQLLRHPVWSLACIVNLPPSPALESGLGCWC